ncbi:MAG TPA: V-type ATP synthase subunit D [Clostridiales bacterium UBA8153]|nr:V-type ATP synthase subunit D [Clostridiales bacterium UBA8153]
MEIRVNATRMELLKLRGRVRMAKRGHKLLKDKRDELMKVFLSVVREVRTVRDQVEILLAAAYRSFLVARAVMSRETMEEALMSPTPPLELQTGWRPIMNVAVPEFTIDVRDPSGVYAYGLATTSPELDSALGAFAEVLPQLVRLAQLERTVELLSDEIARTRRRVNALEYVLIPELQDAVKSIAMRLGEMERSNTTRLMKIKDIVRAK